MSHDAALPTEMTFIESTAAGGPEVLQPARMAVPRPGPARS